MVTSPNQVQAPLVSMQTRIQTKTPLLPPTARRIATAILDNPQMVVDNTISGLAGTCGVSEASIVRFCRAVGTTGYRQFKLQFAAELARETAQTDGDGAATYGSDISASDSLLGVVSKIANREVQSIRETLRALDLDVLERVVRRVIAARRVAVFGVGASNIGAHDLAQKLLRIDHVALAFHDAHDALVCAALLRSDDVAIGFTHSGRTKETVAFLAAARRSGAFTTAITNVPGSPVTEQADEFLATAARETKFSSSAMTSRIAQLAMVDFVFAGVAQWRYNRTVAALKSTYEAVRELRDDH